MVNLFIYKQQTSITKYGYITDCNSAIRLVPFLQHGVQQIHIANQPISTLHYSKCLITSYGNISHADL